jgi:hypothetical protein
MLEEGEWLASRSDRFAVVYYEPKDGCAMRLQKRVQSLAPGEISNSVAWSLH